MGPKKEALNTKERKAELFKLKKHLSKEIIEETFTAADQAYLDFSISERIAQLAVCKDQIEKKTQENEGLRAKIRETEDRYGQRIAALRSKINEKCEEMARLTDENHRFLEGKGYDANSFEDKLNNEDRRFEDTKEKLSSEIKLLNSKLNNLEEFRHQREGLIEKYNKMLDHLRQMEERAAGIVNVYQRLDLINKDRMGQELKDRLLKLSIEFQEASSTETTRSLIRENIAINNELGGHIGSWQILYDENIELKKRKCLIKNNLREEEILRNKCSALNVLQTQVIERLVYEHQKLEEYYKEINNLEKVKHQLEERLEIATEVAKEAEHELKILFQKQHNFQTHLNELLHEENFVRNVIYDQELILKRALLHVADGQDWRMRRARMGLPMDEFRQRLIDIMKELRKLFRGLDALPTDPSSLAMPSVTTIYDPDYGIKFWQGRGISVERKNTRSTLERTASPKKDQGSESSSDSDD